MGAKKTVMLTLSLIHISLFIEELCRYAADVTHTLNCYRGRFNIDAELLAYIKSVKHYTAENYRVHMEILQKLFISEMCIRDRHYGFFSSHIVPPHLNHSAFIITFLCAMSTKE